MLARTLASALSAKVTGKGLNVLARLDFIMCPGCMSARVKQPTKRIRTHFLLKDLAFSAFCFLIQISGSDQTILESEVDHAAFLAQPN